MDRSIENQNTCESHEDPTLVSSWQGVRCLAGSQILSEIAKISARFISAPAADIDSGINEALRITGELAGVDRSYVFLFNVQAGTMSNTHEWCAPGILTQMPELQKVAMSDFPWTLRPILRGAVLYVPRVCDVPDDASSERIVFESGNIQSLICVPLVCRDDVIGFVGFDSVRQEKEWSEDDTSLLRIVGDVLASAIDRKNTMAALYESEEKWRVLAENSADHIMIIDRELRIQFINRSVSRDDPRELIGFHLPSFLSGDDARRAEQCCRRVLHTGQPDAFTCTYDPPNREPVEFDCRVGAIQQHGETIALSICATDITEASRIRAALTESETRLRQMAEHIDSVLWLMDLEPPKLIYVSPSFEDVFGLPCQDLLDDRHCWVRSVHPDDRAWVVKLSDAARTTGSFDIEYRVLLPDGTVRWVHDRAFPIYDADGQLYRMVGLVDDITERRRVEEDLTRARRLESAGQVAGQIAHDFNNLLAPIVAYPDLIRSRIDAPDSVHAMLTDLEDAARQMADINQQLLTLGRRGHYNVTPVDLHALTDKVIRTLDLPESIEISRDFAPDLPMPTAGRAQLARALANIIRNAVEAMNGTGRLTFRTVVCPHVEHPPEWHDRPQGDCVMWSVTDTGPGISPETVESIFDPYFSTKKSDSRRGSGLGLAVAHSVVRDHAGHLAVESRKGEGATFRVYLPLADVEIIDESQPSPLPVGRGECVLVVDDDEIQQRVASTILRDLGYEVTVAKCGTDAIELVTVNRYDLVVLDMVMPGIDGTETLRRIRKIYPGQAAVLLSGYAPGERVHAALDLGAHQFVAKPAGKHELAVAVRSAIDASVASVTA